MKNRNPHMPPEPDELRHRAIALHIEEFIGHISVVWNEIETDDLPIDLLLVEPTPDRNFFTIITAGMSDYPMNTPEIYSHLRFAELLICLPPDWLFDNESLKDERYYWPLRWLKLVARTPHLTHSWLGKGMVLGEAEPQPFAEGVPFHFLSLQTPLLFNPRISQCEISPHEIINFYSMVPLYPVEADYKDDHGEQALTLRLKEYHVTERLNLNRKPIV
jgi:hypothetical protein